MATTTGKSAIVRSLGSSTTRSSVSSTRLNGQSELDEAARLAEQIVDECCAPGVHYPVAQAPGPRLAHHRCQDDAARSSRDVVTHSRDVDDRRQLAADNSPRPKAPDPC
jgi:hypothetical protein